MSKHRGERQNTERGDRQHPAHHHQHGVGHAAKERQLRGARALGHMAKGKGVEQSEQDHREQRPVGSRSNGIERNQSENPRAQRERIGWRNVQGRGRTQPCGSLRIEHQRLKPQWRHGRGKDRTGDGKREHPAKGGRPDASRGAGITAPCHAHDEQWHHQRDHGHAYGIDPRGAHDIEHRHEARGERGRCAFVGEPHAEGKPEQQPERDLHRW